MKIVKFKKKTANSSTDSSSDSFPLESLLQAFQEKYFEAKFQIRQFEIQIQTLKEQGGSKDEIKEIRLKMEALLNRQKSWIKRLSDLINK